MPKRSYREWEQSTEKQVSRHTLRNWKKKGIDFQEDCDIDTYASASSDNISDHVISSRSDCMKAPHTEDRHDALSTSGHLHADVAADESAHYDDSDSEDCASSHSFDFDSDTTTGSTNKSDHGSEPHAQASPGTLIHELDEPLYQGSRVTRGESLLLILGHSLKYHGSKEATENLLKVVEAHLPEDTNFPSTKHHFFKHFTSVKDLLKAYFYCPLCSTYLCTDPSATESTFKCTKCNKCSTQDELLFSGHYFIILDLESQFRESLEKHEHELTRCVPPSYNVGDITGSPAYRKLPMQGDDISFTWSTDGVPVFESSQYSIWPLLLQVNELPYRERTQN